MIFGFQARGGTAPTLTTSTAGYRRSALGESPVVDDFHRYYDHAKDGEGELGLPAAPAFRGQKLGKGRGARGTTKKGHAHLQSRPDRGKRPNEGGVNNDGMGPMRASRPASRQVLSDLMDLNLALKYDKARKHGEARPQKERSHHHHNGSSTREVGRRNDARASATNSSSARRFSAPFDKRHNQTYMRHPTTSEHYQAEPSKAHPSSAVPNVVGNNQFEGNTGLNPDGVGQCDRWNGDLRSAPSKVSVATLATSPSGCFEVYPGKESPVGRPSLATTIASQFKAHEVSARTAYACSESSAWRNMYGSNQQDVAANGFSGQGFDAEEEMGVSLGDTEGRGEQITHPPCHETSSQQSEKDQRMWSALKNSLLSGSEAHTDPPYENLRIGRAEDRRGAPHDDGRYAGNGSIRGNGEARGYGFLTEARDMEQLDQERSAMDRAMRPHRIASARLLETNRNSPSPNKVKHPRTFSASATRPRTYQSELSSSVWTGSTDTLECTGVRAELVLRNGDGQVSFSEESGVNLADHRAFPDEDGTHQQEGGQQQARKVDSGRFQWVTNDEGVANFLQRPPSRQKEAFPTHLADTVPYPAFQVELPVADEEAKQNIDVIRKNAVEQARPSSRHKPPGQSLFLEVSETRRQVPPAFSPSQGPVAVGPEPFSGLSAGILSMDAVDDEATPNCDALGGTIFSLDRRHDNPDRDGFSVLQVQGPCPFRIEVTNSFVQPHPLTVPVALEATLANSHGGTGKTGKGCPPNPSCGFFGSMPCETGVRASTGKQRAPINTTPNLAAPATSSPVQARCDAVGKGGASSMSFLLGSSNRSTGGVAPRGGNTNLVSSPPRHEEGAATVSGIPSPPPRPGTNNREPEREGKLCAPEGRAVGEGVVEESSGWKSKAGTGGVSSTWRADTPGLRVNTGAPGVHVSDWSLQSCDDADDGAFLEGPVSTLGESVGTQHALLETTLGQDFLSLFAPSAGHENSPASGEK